MKIATKSIIDSICRNLIQEHGLLVMFTKDGQPVDRSRTLASAGILAEDGYLNLPFSTDMTVEEVVSAWEALLGFDVTFVEPARSDGDAVHSVANEYFTKSEAGSALTVSPRSHFGGFRRAFREVTGLAVEVLDHEGAPLAADQALSTVGGKAGKLEIDADTKCGDIVDWLEGCGLNARVYKLQPVCDCSSVIGDLLSSSRDEVALGVNDSTGCFSLLSQTLDRHGIPNCEELSFSMFSPLPVIHRIHDCSDSISVLVEQGGEPRRELEDAIDSCLQETDRSDQLWQIDTLVSLLESRDIYLDLNKERNDILVEISESIQDIEAAKQKLKEAILQANECEDILETSLIDEFLATFCFAINQAIENGDEEVVEEWVKGFGFGDFLEEAGGDSVWDIMNELDMMHREEVVPAFMCFMKFNFQVDVMPEGEFRDEMGNTDWDSAIEFIVDSCF